MSLTLLGREVRERAETEDQLDLARRIQALSTSEWGDKRATVLVGRHPRLEEALTRVVRFAASDSPVLLTGETGTGKELFARALYLSSRRCGRPFLRVNCAQYCSDQLIASELFGHRKGSFTGAIADHRGIFEEGNGGVVFLDEIGDLPLPAQSMLLRVLSEGEIVPVGGNHPRVVDVRVVAATSRDLGAMIDRGEFRADLYYRLRQLRVQVPALRERGDDWSLIAGHYLARLGRQAGSAKRLSAEAMRTLGEYAWPGNVREVRSCMETGFHMAEGSLITPDDFAEALEGGSRPHGVLPTQQAAERCVRMIHRGESFWAVIHKPFLDRDLNRGEVRHVIEEGLSLSRGSYKRLISLFNVASDDYLKFMDFLRHHDLKPTR